MIDGAVLARQPSCHNSGEARGGKFVSLCYFTTSAMKAALSVARSPDGRAVARSMESQGTLLGMPSGAGVKEEDMDRPAYSFCMFITEGTRNTKSTTTRVRALPPSSARRARDADSSKKITSHDVPDRHLHIYRVPSASPAPKRFFTPE